MGSLSWWDEMKWDKWDEVGWKAWDEVGWEAWDGIWDVNKEGAMEMTWTNLNLDNLDEINFFMKFKFGLLSLHQHEMGWDGMRRNEMVWDGISWDVDVNGGRNNGSCYTCMNLHEMKICMKLRFSSLSWHEIR